MERLTEWIDNEEDKPFAIVRQDLRTNGDRKCLTKLAKYEDTGFTPEELEFLTNPPSCVYWVHPYIACEPDTFIIECIHARFSKLEIEECTGRIWMNGLNEQGHITSVPLQGYQIEWFLSKEEAIQTLNLKQE